MAALPDLAMIVNPNSGGGRAAKAVPGLVARLQAAGRETTVQFTRSLEHAQVLAEEALRNGRVPVAAGGDGLVSAVVNGVAERPDAVMGILPLGRGNDFARSLGIGVRDDALRSIVEQHDRRVDLGRIAGRYFTTIASVGIDSVVIEAANGVRRIRSRAVYPYAGVRALLGWSAVDFEMVCDGRPESLRGYSVAIANGAFFGGGMRYAPTASLDDGLFEVVTVGDIAKRTFVRQGLGVFRGTHVNHPAVVVRSATDVTIESAGGLRVYADGEPVGLTPVHATVRPQALRVLATPAGAS